MQPSSSCGLSEVERSRSHESTPCLTVLGSSIGGCQTNVERCKVRLHRPEPCMTRSAGRTIPVSWQRGQAGPKGSTVIHGWISTGRVGKESTFSRRSTSDVESRESDMSALIPETCRAELGVRVKWHLGTIIASSVSQHADRFTI